jgi:hypothetical protein
MVPCLKTPFLSVHVSVGRGKMSNGGLDMAKRKADTLISEICPAISDVVRATDSEFWKEREEGFRRHASGEHSSLAADWCSMTDTWKLRAGAGKRSERIFRSLTRKAIRGPNGTAGADPCKAWLDALRHAEYIELRFTHEGAYNQKRRDYLARSGEAVPVAEGIDETVALPDGSAETRTLIGGITGTIERIFETSADFCLELGSYAPADATERRRQKDGIEDVRAKARKMLDEGATHRQVCQRLKDADRPPRTAWRHLPWDKAYMTARDSVCKWLSKNCRP